ncbi:hypothetical protein JZU56_01950, partial [bacterium]|nr:hypothetical protein [bacterium]
NPFEKVAMPAGDLEDWFVLKGFDGFRVPPSLAAIQADSAAIVKIGPHPMAIVGLPEKHACLVVFSAKPFQIDLAEGEWCAATLDEKYAAALGLEKGMCFLIIVEGNLAKAEKLADSERPIRASQPKMPPAESKKIRCSPLLAGGAVLLASLAAASSSLLSREESVRRVVAHFAAQAGLGPPAWLDRLAGAGFDLFGWWGADIARALVAGGKIVAVFLIAGLVLSRLSVSIRRRGCFVILAAALFLMVAEGLRGLRAWRTDLRDVRLLTSERILTRAAQTGGRIFFNRAARFQAPLFIPDPLPPGLTLPFLDALSESPIRWREEDRKDPFSAVVLATPLENSRSLVDLLSASPQWHLACV